MTTQIRPKGRVRLRLYLIFAVNTIVQRKANHNIKWICRVLLKMI